MQTIIPTTKNSVMAHTAIVATVKKEITRIARTTGVHQNVVINTLLVEGLKHMEDFMAKAYATKKKATKKVAKKTSAKK